MDQGLGRKSLRKQVQEKLIKFAARVPVFMYLTDFRGQTNSKTNSKGTQLFWLPWDR